MVGCRNLFPSARERSIFFGKEMLTVRCRPRWDLQKGGQSAISPTNERNLDAMGSIPGGRGPDEYSVPDLLGYIPNLHLYILLVRLRSLRRRR